jgi:uroporphyrinogen-III synthase
MQNNINILCTRPLPPSLLAEAGKEGITIDELSFIETTPIQSIEVQQEIEQAALQITTVVFTSMNAVDAVANYLDNPPTGWSIYCIGTTTNELVKKYFGEQTISGTANSAAELALLIAEDEMIDEVIFFCGDQRRDELPEILSSNNIAVTEITVYQTIAVTHTISKEYHGILFFSPSAVNSFFINNKLPASTLLFAIGSTTANEIKKYTTNKIIISNQPGKENLVAKMMEYFT